MASFLPFTQSSPSGPHTGELPCILRAGKWHASLSMTDPCFSLTETHSTEFWNMCGVLAILACSTTRTMTGKRSCLYITHWKYVVEIKCEFFTNAFKTTKSRIQPRCSAFPVAQISRCILGIVNSASSLTATLALSAGAFFGRERVHQSGGSSAVASVYFEVLSVFTSQGKSTPRL